MGRYRDDDEPNLPLDLDADDDDFADLLANTYAPIFPKAARKAKERKPLTRKKAPRTRPKPGEVAQKYVTREKVKGKAGYTTDQRLRRQKEDQLYRRVTRPKYLLDLARRQGHLVRQTSELHGDTMQAKFAGLFATELPRCEAAIHEAGCNGELPALEVHHKRGRGPYLNDTSTFVGVCSKCHAYIEANPRWAKEVGLSESKIAKYD